MPEDELFDVIFGDTLDWDSQWVNVSLDVELPFWLMMDDCKLQLPVGGAQFDLKVRDSYVQLFVGYVSSSGRTLVWQGPEHEQPGLSEEAAEALNRDGAAPRLCRTILRIRGRAHADVFAALADR